MADLIAEPVVDRSPSPDLPPPATPAADIATLRASEERYRALFTRMDEAYAVVEVLADDGGRWHDFRFLEVNPPFMRHTGMPYPVGRTATELLGTPNPRWATLYGHVAETGESLRLEERELTLGRLFDLNVFRIGGEGSRQVAVLFTDITQRRAAEDALRESEHRRQLALDAAGIGDWSVAVETGVLECSPRARALHGVAPGEPVTLARHDALIDPADRGAVQAARVSALDPAGSGEYRIVFRFHPPGGPMRWIESIGRGLFVDHPDGRRATHLIGAMVDITERRRVEDAVRAGEARAQALVATLPGAAVFVFDHELRYRLAGGEAFRAAGFTAEAFVGRTIAEVLEPALVSQYAPLVQRALRGESFELEHRAHGRHFLTRGGPLAGATGDVREALAVSVDVTARRFAEFALAASEARFRTLVEHVRDYAIFLLDADGVVTEWSAGAERVTGHGAGDALGRYLAFLYPPEDVAAGLPAAHLAEAAATGRGEWEGWRMRRDGQRFWANEIATAVRAPDGTLVGFTKITRDLTERRRAEEETARARRVAEAERARAETERARAEEAWRASEAASRAKSEFLNVMSHELRTPLNAIGGYAELLRLGIRGPVTPQQVEDLQRIATSQRHLLGLINEVLNYAKLEAGAVDFALADVPLAGALAEAVALVAPQAQAKGLALGIVPCGDALAVRADPDKLRQILLNLLSNAVKFTAAPTDPQEGGGHVVVYCEAVVPDAADAPATGDARVPGEANATPSAQVVHVHVTDTGIGIPADKLSAVFEPFVQVRSDLARPHEGTGLGLAISRDLARGMGGEITVRSTLGVGSTFTLVLPVAVMGGDRRADGAG